MPIDVSLIPAIQQRAHDFRDHGEIDQGLIERWVENFDEEDHPLATRILEQIDYTNGARIRSLTEQLVNKVLANLPGVPAELITFVPVGGVTSGSMVVMRALRTYKRKCHGAWRIIDMAKLISESPDTIEVIVFVDDFSGSGKTLIDWWPTVETLVLPIDATVIFGLLVLNCLAQGNLVSAAFSDGIVSAKFLDESRNLFFAGALEFNDAEKERILDYCVRSGASTEYRRGYRDCGLLLAFRHLCPNNSLPILWHDTDNWNGLFERHSL